MKIGIFDIEADGLYNDVTKIHCVAIQILTDEEASSIELFTDIPKAVEVLRGCDLLVAHNGINYDIPVLAKMGYEVNVPIHDTLIISKLACPDMLMKDQTRVSVPTKLKGKHSLKAWGYRLRKLKGDFHEDADWSTYTEEMGEYCKQDVVVTMALYNKLLQYNTPSEAIELEQGFAEIISRQEKYGVYFDVKKAEKLHVSLIEETEKIEEELYKVFTPLKTWTPKSYPKVPIKKDGTKTATLKSHEAMGCHYNSKGEWGYYKLVSFEPSSRQKIARWLEEVYGWKPTKLTEKGNIIINEDVLSSLQFPEGKLLAHYFNVKKLIAQLAEGKNAWLKLVDDDSRIRGHVDTLGAVSRRCTHSKPNLAQVPSSRAYKGSEVRELFSVPKGKKMVGCDADGLELRTLSHYMARYDGGKYAQVVDKGDKDKGTDIHTTNQKAAGLPTRDDAKTFIYAFLYGAGAAKIGSIIKGSPEAGEKLKRKFLGGLPALRKLLEAVESVYKQTGTLKALDGNPYHIRSSHSALNTLLQGAGALIMKHYAIKADKSFKTKGWIHGEDYEFVLSVHDEYQWEVSEEIADEFSMECERVFNDVTKELNFRVPLRGTADIGDNWSQTH